MGANKNLLVTVSDKNHLETAKQLFSSAYFEGGWNEDMMLLAHQEPGNEIQERELKEFREKGIIVKKCRPIPDNIIGKFKHKVMFDTLYLFKSEFKKWKNIIYLDNEMMVAGPLNRLKKLRGFSAVPKIENLYNCFLGWKKVEGDAKKESTLKNLSSTYNLNTRSFNSDIFVFNTIDIIQDMTFKNMINLLKKYKILFTKDSESLYNLFFYNKWKRLPYIYNNYIGDLFGWSEKNLYDAKVLNFTGKDKAWKKPNPLHHIWILNIIKFKKINLEDCGTRKEWRYLKEILKSTKIEIGIAIHKKQYIKPMNFNRADFRKRTKHILKRFGRFTRVDLPRILYEKIINKNLGRIGIFVNRNFPKIYKLIKGLKSE